MSNQLPTDNNTPAGTPAPTSAGDGQSNQLPSSKQILEQAGVEAPQVNWKAKYDGVVGASRQRITELQGQLEAKDLEIAGLKDQLAKLQGDNTTLKGQADEAAELKQQLTQAQAEVASAKTKTDKQALLLKYPALLALKQADGSNPMVDVLMAADMPIDQLDARLAQLAAATWGAAAPSGSTPPPPPPVSGAEDVETLRAKALEIDRKRHTADSPELKEQSRQAWDAFRKAQRAQQQH